MINILIKSYDEHFDTFACVFTQDGVSFESLLPATLLPYIAPHLCAMYEDLPYDLVGCSFNMTHPESAA